MANGWPSLGAYSQKRFDDSIIGVASCKRIVVVIFEKPTVTSSTALQRRGFSAVIIFLTSRKWDPFNASNLDVPNAICYTSHEVVRPSAGRKQMALGFSPLMLNKSKGGEIMSDFEIISVVVMIASLVLKAIQFGRDSKNKKK